MKCKHCGGEQFVAHQVCRMDVLVDGSGDYIDAVHPKDLGLDIYDSEAAYGPFQCCGCGAEYDKLADGEDFIADPIDGWSWEEEPEEDESAALKVKQVASITNCRVTIKDNGNGKDLFSGTGQAAASSPFGECRFEAISMIGRALVLWLPHDEVQNKAFK